MKSSRKITASAIVLAALLGIIALPVTQAGSRRRTAATARGTGKPRSIEAGLERLDRIVSSMGTDWDPWEAHLVCWCFRNNPVRAEKDLKNKVFWVEGTISRIDRGPDGIVYVALKGPKEDDEPTLDEVNCYFIRRREASVARLNRGDQIIVKGVCLGREPMGDVMMGGCRIRP